MIASRPSSVIETRQPVVVDGDTYFKSDWIDTGRDPHFSPTTFLVEQQPHVSLRTHFHAQDQFQLFLRGSGSIGRHPIRPAMVHYATAATAYGPIVAGGDGLAWLTLRTAWETGSLTMKDNADRMVRGHKKQFHSKPVETLAPGALAALDAPVVDDPIPLQPDGTSARMVAIPPGAHVAPLDASHCRGQFRVVLAGSLEVGDRALGAWEHCFVDAAEAATPLVAGPGGAQVVILQFPAAGAGVARG